MYERKIIGNITQELKFYIGNLRKNTMVYVRHSISLNYFVGYSLVIILRYYNLIF